MVYDCFLFNNELDILDIRLHELSNVVDKFVLVESTVTHVNRTKPLYFKENKSRYKNFLHKIVHVVVQDTPDVNLAWIINDYQFSQMMRGLTKCKNKDTIIFGDVDEIPRASAIAKWKDKPGNLKVFKQKLFYYYLNLLEYTKTDWLGTHMTTYGYLCQLDTTWIAKYTKPNTLIPNGGWHFSYIGDVKQIQQKINSMAHQEYNNKKYNTPEKILKAIYKQKDLFDHGYKFKITDISTLPTYIRKNKQKFNHILISPDLFQAKAFFLPPFLNAVSMLKDAGRKLIKK